jgi:serine/threonine-protein kinase
MSESSSSSGQSSSPVDLSGRTLGVFHLLRRLGKGAMAEVYLAEQPALARKVAVKILKPDLAVDATYLKRFQREARAAAALVHANIVQIYEVGQVESLHYIAQEYVEGQNLRQWLTRNGPPDLTHAVSILRQVAAALTKAAEQGIVHRDIKPENILVTRTGEVKVADFGLARMACEGDAQELTQVGMTLGTPLYMSPEQVEGKPLDSRSDIYSLGVTCYHMLTGAPPFQGETALAVAVQHLKKQARPVGELRPDLPAAMVRIVHKMLAKDPDQRYSTPQELLRDLRKLQTECLSAQWPEDLPGWEPPGSELTLPALGAPTERLDSLMRKMAILSAPRRRLGIWLFAASATFALGGLLAWTTLGRTPLLPGGGQLHHDTPRQESALRQFYFASRIGTEEAWESVARYFPQDDYLVARAKQQLARIYLREQRYRQALAVFEELIIRGVGEENQEFRVFGLTGKAGVLTLEGRYQDSATVLEELLSIPNVRGKLKDPQMRQMLDSVIRKNHEALGAPSTPQWKQWLEERFGQGG